MGAGSIGEWKKVLCALRTRMKHGYEVYSELHAVVRTAFGKTVISEKRDEISHLRLSE